MNLVEQYHGLRSLLAAIRLAGPVMFSIEEWGQWGTLQCVTLIPGEGKGWGYVGSGCWVKDGQRYISSFNVIFKIRQDIQDIREKLERMGYVFKRKRVVGVAWKQEGF